MLEERQLKPVAGGGIETGARDTVDEPLRSKSAQVIGHVRRRVRAAQERGDRRAQGGVSSALQQMGEGGQRVEQRHDAGVAEVQRGGPLPMLDGRLLEPVLRVVREHALVTGALDFEDPTVT